ncbi:MAG: hypothetical protein DWI58_17955 [Chloroflexi bacterium]|nr:MAG: hypothetical protein DWI58_17955 [Chloroflexota bacterium]
MVRRLRVHLACLQGAADVVVVGDCDDVEFTEDFDALEDRAGILHAVTERGVDLQVGTAKATSGGSIVGH